MCVNILRKLESWSLEAHQEKTRITNNFCNTLPSKGYIQSESQKNFVEGKLTEILSADEARAQILLSLKPEEAVQQSAINALGKDFTVDELREFGNALSFATQPTDSLTGLNMAKVLEWNSACS
ncbi:MAG: hypothetical protein FWG14_00665 [Peptococcaceae bacterium]|nr:hypothetical protein [Peptococcaceae bacterium]